MAAETVYDLLVIGGGPAGYVGALRAAQLGLKVACAEMEPQLGGTCLRVGCIPSKALLESSEHVYMARHHLKDHGLAFTELSVDLAQMMKRKDGVVGTMAKGIVGLFKKAGVTHLKGRASFTGPRTDQGWAIKVEGAKGGSTHLADKVMIATGSSASDLRGVKVDGDRIGTSTEALSWAEVPDRLVVIGAGAIGLELGSVWSRLGSQVTVLEYFDEILFAMDPDLRRHAKRILTKQGLEFRLGVRVTGAKVKGEVVSVEIEGADPVECDRLLVAVGRRPNTTGLGLEHVGLELDDRGRVPVDEHFATALEGVYAVGDVIAGPMLAHKAEEDAVACVETIVTGYGHVDYDLVPLVVYTDPEVAAVGQTEPQLKEAEIPYRKGLFPFGANGRAHAIGSIEGTVKILAHAETDRVLGVHIIGPRAGDLIAEAATAMAFGASSEDIARVCHAHPSLPETLKEAALAVDGRAIHR